MANHIPTSSFCLQKKLWKNIKPVELMQ